MNGINMLLQQEVRNRFHALPIAERIDAARALIRITTEVTIELLAQSPESFTEYLRKSPTQMSSGH